MENKNSSKGRITKEKYDDISSMGSKGLKYYNNGLIVMVFGFFIFFLGYFFTYTTQSLKFT